MSARPAPTMPQQRVNYRLAAPTVMAALTAAKRCGSCSMYHPGPLVPQAGSCDEVAGDIFAGAVCRDYFPAGPDGPNVSA